MPDPSPSWARPNAVRRQRSLRQEGHEKHLPKNGPPDAYAPGANYKDEAFMARLRALRKGDSVTIMFTTDGERHRILALRKN